MAEALASIDLHPIHQHVIGPFVADFAFPDAKLVVECDGVYWHNRPQQKAKDRKRNYYLRSNGWTVLRFSEIDINRCAPKLAEIVRDCLTRAAQENVLHLRAPV
jgi:very-short-patch-repair endonuclease